MALARISFAGPALSGDQHIDIGPCDASRIVLSSRIRPEIIARLVVGELLDRPQRRPLFALGPGTLNLVK